MTPKQRIFADHVLDGKSYAEAHRLAYPKSVKWGNTMLRVEASRVAAAPKVKAYIDQCRAEIRAASNLTREDILQAMGKIVKRIGKDANAPANAVVAAGERAARMLGCDAPTKIEMKVEGSLLFRIRKSASK